MPNTTDTRPDSEGMVTFELNNYRCFNRSSPVRFDLRPGITAFVGPNNCGKTTILRMFYELRQLWNAIGDPALPANNKLGTTFIATDAKDQFDILHSKNGGDLAINLGIGGRTALFPTIGCETTRQSPASWQLQLTWPGPRPDQKTQLNFLTELRGDLFDTLYIGAFRNVINSGSTSYYDLSVGSGFVDQWRIWKTGTDKSKNRLAVEVENDIKRIFGYQTLQINAESGGGTLQVIVDGDPFRLDEMGSGLAQFIITFASAALKRPSYILIDEPELNLHPSLQLDFLMSLSKYARRGTIFATHSIGLARSAADQSYSLRKVPEGISCVPLQSSTNLAEFLGEMSFSSYQELGFETVLLVEGVHEVKAVQSFLRLYEKEHKVVILQLGGDTMIDGRREHELAEMKRLSSRVCVLIDSEKKTPDDTVAEKRASFVEVCQALGFNIHVTKRRATENYFTARALELALGHSVPALGPFELKGAWSKTQNWRIASFMTRADLEATDLHDFFKSL